MKAALLAVTLAAPASAQEFIAVPEPLSDLDFYRVVACAADPGGECRKPFLRWPEAQREGVTVGLASRPAGVPADHLAPFDAALDRAIAQVNASGSGIALTRSDADPAIAIHIVTTAPGQIMEGTGVAALDGARLPLARVALSTRSGEIRQALIAISIFAAPQARSVLLEEVVQALGLMTDVAGPAYAGSLFAEDANTTDRLDGQDAIALRLHYPRED